MNITCISDTHNHHSQLDIKNGGCILIHAGDLTEYGTLEELEDFFKWFGKQNFEHKICIAGNHDLSLENISNKLLKQLIPKEVHYLENNTIKIEGLKIWGSPCTPYFLGMAFNKRRGEELKKHWSKIPKDTDILVTHTPPYGILDQNLGCESLLERIEIIKPKLHVFGHIHENRGIYQHPTWQTTFVNASNYQRRFDKNGIEVEILKM
jgi:Icc-related predicted phosphoesterase